METLKFYKWSEIQSNDIQTNLSKIVVTQYTVICKTMFTNIKHFYKAKYLNTGVHT